jgi:hypothetical protein
VLIGLFPELDAPGGVLRASRHMAAVMSEFASSRGMECRLISLNDSPELHRMTLGGREFVFTGCDRAKGRFIATAFRAARRKVKVVLAAHPNLGPVVQSMRMVAPRLKSIVCAWRRGCEPLSGCGGGRCVTPVLSWRPAPTSCGSRGVGTASGARAIRVLHWGRPTI